MSKRTDYHIDWSLILTMLRRHYKPLSTIGLEIGSDGNHLNNLARGDVQQPKFDVAMRLLDLYYDHVPAEKRTVMRGMSDD